MIGDPYSSRARPVLTGRSGAIAAAHPLAVAAGQSLLEQGGSAADAMIAAQAVLCVIMPDACGLGGDMFCLVRAPGEDQPMGVNAAGVLPRRQMAAASDGAQSITVPGIVQGWADVSSRWGRLGLAAALAPALRIARDGFCVGSRLARSVAEQRGRLLAGGAGAWALMQARPGEDLAQPALAATLESIAAAGAAGFYQGAAARAIEAAVARLGGWLDTEDLRRHRGVAAAALCLGWRGIEVLVQPPMSQGILLLMALAAEARHDVAGDLLDHAGIELTEAVFAYRARAGQGGALLAERPALDTTRAARRGGPRAYLHTAGVAVADAQGMVISSLVSVFDDFGSCVFVPECGITLNNRAGGFTEAPNEAAPGKAPVHTLAPILVRTGQGWLGLATPGADGQVQVLLQILVGLARQGLDLARAIDQPRWRSQGGQVLIERRHASQAGLAALGHDLVPVDDGDVRFGGVVGAGSLLGRPVSVADWRRESWAGVC
jgi:gamma-glutamyltranspeptidase/glutathione hydrolase